MHLLSSDKIFCSMAIWHKCLEHSVVFPVNRLWRNLHLMFLLLRFSWNSQVWRFFSFILGIETSFWEGLKVFCVVLMKDKSSHIKKYKIMMVRTCFFNIFFNFFRNQLWLHLIRNMDMCLLKVAMCEKCKSSHFQSE